MFDRVLNAPLCWNKDTLDVFLPIKPQLFNYEILLCQSHKVVIISMTRRTTDGMERSGSRKLKYDLIK